MKTISVAAVVLGAAFLTAPSFAQPAAPKDTCFSMTQFENWKAPDAKTIYIRVNMNRYYRLGLAGTCSELTWPQSHLITHTRGPDMVCGPLDWNLSVSDSTGPMGHGFAEPCIVKTMTELSPAQVAAIPKKFKP
jgi:Family of unknown function (DUF6491)